MHLLLFEVTPFPERRNEYLDIAARLKPELERSGGCLHIERFRNLVEADHLLSFQLWEDEASLVAWRRNAAHRDMQLHGRDKVFEDYRLRVAEVQPSEEHSGPVPAALADAAANGRLVMVMQSASASPHPAQCAGLRVESFASLYRADQYLHVIQPDAGQVPRVFALRAADPEQCHLAVVTRDYGMFERQEAPEPAPAAHRQTERTRR